MRIRFGFVLIAVLVLAACAPSAPQSPGGSEQQPAPGARQGSKTITIGLDEEIKTFWDSITLGGTRPPRSATIAAARTVSPNPAALIFFALIELRISFDAWTNRFRKCRRIRSTCAGGTVLRHHLVFMISRWIR